MTTRPQPPAEQDQRPADQDGRSWDGKEPAIVAVAAAYFVIVVAAVRIAVLLA
jgi:hypothetical protein